MKKYLLRGFGFLGILVFVPLFLLTFSDSQMVEKSAKHFIEWKLQNEINTKIDSIQLPQSKIVEKVFGAKSEMLAVVKQKLKEDAPTILTTQLAKMADLNCECRTKWKERLSAFVEVEMASLEKAKEKLTDFMSGKYMETVEKLTRDMRIFLGLNGLCFIFLLLISFLKPQATEHLFLPSSLLLLSSAICSYVYLFQQNWFYTILYNDYMGFGYLAYFIIVFALLCDIVFNRAKVTSRIVNFLANALGSAFTLPTC
ncbi:hypothetical protein [Sulfurospirillum halorespirans]|uniref:hypothetical protein n=1 Tax=Sulfurospirillum halorespirans TaxID=194424 RepID=UPI00084A0C1D|nr:hypothetical protein [Sulfurospirillum halorespirans]